MMADLPLSQPDLLSNPNINTFLVDMTGYCVDGLDAMINLLQDFITKDPSSAASSASQPMMPSLVAPEPVKIPSFSQMCLALTGNTKPSQEELLSKHNVLQSIGERLRGTCQKLDQIVKNVDEKMIPRDLFSLPAVHEPPPHSPVPGSAQPKPDDLHTILMNYLQNATPNTNTSAKNMKGEMESTAQGLLMSTELFNSNVEDSNVAKLKKCRACDDTFRDFNHKVVLCSRCKKLFYNNKDSEVQPCEWHKKSANKSCKECRLFACFEAGQRKRVKRSKPEGSDLSVTLPIQQQKGLSSVASLECPRESTLLFQALRDDQMGLRGMERANHYQGLFDSRVQPGPSDEVKTEPSDLSE